MRPARRLAHWLGPTLAAALGACASQSPVLPAKPITAGSGLVVEARPVPLNPLDPSQDRAGDFVYAGGIELTSPQTARLHGLSDVLVGPDGSMTAVSDDGDLLQGRLVLDAQGRLAGLTDARLAPLTGPGGEPIQGKENGDAEGLAILPNGDRLVSFERNQRILLYPAAGGPPRPVPAPDAALPLNGGMEALAADPAAGPDAYIVGAEESGETWRCRVSTACAKADPVALPNDYSLVAMRKLADGAMVYLFRAFDPIRGVRNILQITGADGEAGRLSLSRPLTVDNFEGVDVTPGDGGAMRIYLLSDDNFSSSQRTLLLAFDWRPKPKGGPDESH